MRVVGEMLARRSQIVLRIWPGICSELEPLVIGSTVTMGQLAGPARGRVLPIESEKLLEQIEAYKRYTGAKRRSLGAHDAGQAVSALSVSG